MTVATFLLRVELPDRPGALGAVASRIGAVRGDLVAVEVVEHREGKAVDEFVVELADGDHLSLLLSEIAEVDGVALQDVRPVSGRRHDRRLEAYTTALIILNERSPHGVLGALVTRVCAELDATWSAVLDVEGISVIASHGRPPAMQWLVSSLDASRTARTAGTASSGTGTGTDVRTAAGGARVRRVKPAPTPAHERAVAGFVPWGPTVATSASWTSPPGTSSSPRVVPDGASAHASAPTWPRWRSSPTPAGRR